VLVEPRAPHDVEAIRQQLTRVLATLDDQGRVVSGSRWGAYCFYDYDGEPIYVGQTSEQLRVRIRRHLTNQRTDAVAMNVLDPFEVCDIEMWPLWEYQNIRSRDGAYPSAVAHLNRLELTVYETVLASSVLGAVLNEKEIPKGELTVLPMSIRGRIIPDDIYPVRKHSDVRIARRAQTIAALAKVISERDVSTGLRRTLLTQAMRLELLSRDRLEELAPGGVIDPESGDGSSLAL